MKRYYVVAETPLKYHKFLCVVLWIGGVLTLANAINALAEYSEYGLTNTIYFAIDAVYLSIAVVIRFVTAYGLRRFAKYSWYTVIGMGYFEAGCSLLFAVLYSTLNLFSEATQSAGRAIGGLFVAILVNIYYAKRKPLFFGDVIHETNSKPVPYVGAMTINGEYTPVDYVPGAVPEIRFCHRCGNEVAPGSRFCGKCGTKLSHPEN